MSLTERIIIVYRHEGSTRHYTPPSTSNTPPTYHIHFNIHTPHTLPLHNIHHIYHAIHTPPTHPTYTYIENGKY